MGYTYNDRKRSVCDSGFVAFKDYLGRKSTQAKSQTVPNSMTSRTCLKHQYKYNFIKKIIK